MIDIDNYIENLKAIFPKIENLQHWEIIDNLEEHLMQIINKLDTYYKIGANAVLSPGTILVKNSIVKRLELIEQIK